MDCATHLIHAQIDSADSASKKSLKICRARLEKLVFVADAVPSSSKGIEALQQNRSLN
jgi:hypothetical protein